MRSRFVLLTCFLTAATLVILSGRSGAEATQSAEVFEIGWIAPSTAVTVHSDGEWTYSAGPSGLECLNKQDGRIRWRRSWPEGGDPFKVSQRSWMIVRNGILCVRPDPVELDQQSKRLYYGFDASNGRLISPPSSDPITTDRDSALGPYAVEVGEGNEVTVRERRSGQVRWHRARGPSEHERRPLYYAYRVLEDRILLAGPYGELVMLNLADGRLLWRRSGSDSREGVHGYSSSLLVDGGIVFASHPSGKLAAIESETGRLRWERRLSGSPVAVRGEYLLLGASWGMVHGAVRKRDGSIVWSDLRRRYQMASLSSAEPVDPDRLIFYCMEDLGVPDGSKVFFQVATQLSVSLSTGRLLRRRQPWIWEGGPYWETVATGSFVAQYRRKPLPTTPRKRRAAAALLVESLLGSRMRRYVDFSLSPTHEEIREAMHLSLNLDEPLIRLGKDAAPALLAFLDRTVRTPLPPENQEQEAPRRLSEALRYLELMGLTEASPKLLDLFRLAASRSEKEELARALIRLDCRDAREDLAEFAMQSDAIQPAVRHACLRYVCRTSPPNGRRALGEDLLQRRLTNYLREVASADFTGDHFAQYENIAGEVRQFAQFELNARDRETAENLWKKQPPRYDEGSMQTLSGKGFGEVADSVRVGPDGVEWGVAQRGGQIGDQWFLLRRSPGETRWRALLAGASGIAPERGKVISSDLQIEAIGRDRVTVSWKESRWYGDPPDSERRIEIDTRDLLRDTDGDGLTDALERYVGLNPSLADTNGNGVPDADDQAPKSFKHRLTTDEATLRAALWALFRWTRIAGNDPFYGLPNDYNIGSLLSRVIVLATPPGSKGIEIPESPATLLCEPIDHVKGNYLNGFAPPSLDEEGRYSPPSSHWMFKRYDPLHTFSPMVGFKPIFREYFPYRLSRDGKTARVAFKGLEIAVRKTNGEWRPVSCGMIPGADYGGAIVPWDYRDRSGP